MILTPSHWIFKWLLFVFIFDYLNFLQITLGLKILNHVCLHQYHWFQTCCRTVMWEVTSLQLCSVLYCVDLCCVYCPKQIQDDVTKDKEKKRKSNSWFEGLDLLTDGGVNAALDLPLALFLSHESSINSTLPDLRVLVDWVYLWLWTFPLTNWLQWVLSSILIHTPTSCISDYLYICKGEYFLFLSLGPHYWLDIKILPDCMSQGHPKECSNKIDVFLNHGSALSDHLHLDWERQMSDSYTKYIQQTHLFNIPTQLYPDPYTDKHVYTFTHVSNPILPY